MDGSNQDKFGGRASVVLMKGHGEKRVRQALMQDLIRNDIVEDVQEVLDEIEKKRADIEALNHSLCETEKQLNEHRKIYYDALRAKQREDKRNENIETAKIVIAIGGGVFLIVLLSMMICRAIFG